MNLRKSIKFDQSKDDFAAISASQKKEMKRLAEKIKTNELLSGAERFFIANVLLYAAQKVPNEEPRSPGQARTINHGDVIMMYAALRKSGDNKSKAYKKLAELFDVSEETIKKILMNKPAVKTAEDMLQNARVVKRQPKKRVGY